MAKFVSARNPISASALKRKPLGSVIVRHWGRDEELRLVRCCGGWRVEHGSAWVWPPVIMSSAAVARECNKAVGCKESWARIY